ncbi:GNAT family N-acetyltransferase [Defluviicoccus vanus]|uniref:GNAT family N-acetyltransferase n=1 Tax=Defluviicoccus vanus TaxID=111831 RepID=UPI001CBA6A38|nr:GNAT family N-acyltransferase [Defluviicoccus vanus]
MQPFTVKNFQVRLAASDADLDASQALRYRVFYEEMAAIPSPEVQARRRDFDHFDPVCDHLLVLDMNGGGQGSVVGTYRLLRRSVALQHSGFYTEQEYDLDGVLTHPGEIVEVGRSCVDAAYRSRGVMQLLWRGLADYVRVHEIQVMFGCASFSGTDPTQVGAQLSYLYHHHLAPEAIRPRALPELYVSMNLLSASEVDGQAVLNDLPPLIKGYLRVGGYVGDGAVVDHQFNTTDVCVIVNTDQLTGKYERRYKRLAAEQEES